MKQHTRSHTSFDEAFAYEVLSVVEEIPEGKVATYGQIARLIGKEKNSRLVARALSHAEQFGEFSCHRVVNHAGRLAPGWVEQGFLLMQEGVELKELIRESADRVHILVGSGVTPEVINCLTDEIGARYFHMSGKKIIDSGMKYRKEQVNMGMPGMSEYEIYRTDEEQVRLARKIMNQKCGEIR